MPPAVHPHHHPHDDTHGGNAIHNDDYTGLGHDHYLLDDEPADVTVSDLLDAYVADLSHFCDLIPYAHRDVFDSFHRVKDAVAAHKRLSPEERAEFDRRTT